MYRSNIVAACAAAALTVAGAGTARGQDSTVYLDCHASFEVGPLGRPAQTGDRGIWRFEVDEGANSVRIRDATPFHLDGDVTFLNGGAKDVRFTDDTITFCPSRQTCDVEHPNVSSGAEGSYSISRGVLDRRRATFMIRTTKTLSFGHAVTAYSGSCSPRTERQF